tara:strand:+ start:386 stop:847 length:462 start_codon:yes stop_codon:yes gene_type:complete
MALRPDRNEHLTDLSFFMNETAERGILVVASTQGSGAAMDDSSAAVKIGTAVARATDAPVGLLLNDVVNLDLTRQHINYAKDEMQKGGKVLLMRVGTVTTDQISGAITMGDPAHFMGAGQLCSATANSNSAVIGRWLSKKDADGYAKVAINIV